MKANFIIPCALALISIFSSCKDDVMSDPCGENKELCQYNDGVFIINEGQFLAGNASVSFYDPVSQSVETEIFQKANGRQLGDIAQSMAVTSNLAYVVVNNSQKVEMVDPGSFQEVGTMTGFVSPRHIYIVDNTKAYVSDIGGMLFVVNPNTGVITKEITTDGWTENMALVGNELFIVQRTSYLVGTEVSNVLVFNVIADELIKEIDVPTNPSSLALDADQNIWVLCGGDSIDAPALVAINPFIKEPFRTINLEDKTLFGGPSELISNADGTELYYLNGDLYRISAQATSEPVNALISPPYSIYDFAVDPSNGDIYCADAVDFVQTGNVYRYANDGTLIENFEVGIVPGDFAFN